MTGQQFITLNTRRLTKSSILTQRPSGKTSKRFIPTKTRAHHPASNPFAHPLRIQLANCSFLSTPHRETARGYRVSDTYPNPRCPTCAAEIKTNFNLTTQIEEKCKCLDCKAFLPTQIVIKGVNDQSYSKADQKDKIIKLKQENLMDYFGLFGIEKKFLGLDLSKLKKSYHLWQQIVHPDFSQHSNNHSSDSSLKFMKDWSAQINRAKDILSGDLTRAEYLVELHSNIKLADETDSLQDMGLLMEIMESREQLEAAATRQEVESIHLSNQQSIQEVLNSLNSIFEKLIHNQDLRKDEIDELKGSIIKFRYLENIQKIISSKYL